MALRRLFLPILSRSLTRSVCFALSRVRSLVPSAGASLAASAVLCGEEECQHQRRQSRNRRREERGDTQQRTGPPPSALTRSSTTASNRETRRKQRETGREQRSNTGTMLWTVLATQERRRGWIRRNLPHSMNKTAESSYSVVIFQNHCSSMSYLCTRCFPHGASTTFSATGGVFPRVFLLASPVALQSSVLPFSSVFHPSHPSVARATPQPSSRLECDVPSNHSGVLSRRGARSRGRRCIQDPRSRYHALQTHAGENASAPTTSSSTGSGGKQVQVLQVQSASESRVVRCRRCCILQCCGRVDGGRC